MFTTLRSGGRSQQTFLFPWSWEGFHCSLHAAVRGALVLFRGPCAVLQQKYRLTSFPRYAGQRVPRGTLPCSCWGHTARSLPPSPASGGGLLGAFSEHPLELFQLCYLRLMPATAS